MLTVCPGQAQVNKEVTKVYVVFKTHLDVGFTDLSSIVEKRYINEFIPKAMDVAEKLRADGSGERYVWTTGSWLIWKYLQTAAEAMYDAWKTPSGKATASGTEYLTLGKARR